MKIKGCIELSGNEVIENHQFVRDHISARGKFELLAEEASELSQAALKMVRILNQDEPGDVFPINQEKYDLNTCNENLQEEIADVLLCLGLIYKEIDLTRFESKISKMKYRINDNEWKAIYNGQPNC